jgi:hypothetical protein
MGTVALGIRHVLCAPLRLVRYLDRADLPSDTKTTACSISMPANGVLLLRQRARRARFTRHRGGVSPSRTRAFTARRSNRPASSTSCEIAAEIQRALLPPVGTGRYLYEAMGTSLPSRSIGGDFFDFTHRLDGGFGFARRRCLGQGPCRGALAQAQDPGPLQRGAESTEGTPAQIDPHRQPLASPAARSSEVRHGVSRDPDPDRSCSPSAIAGHNPPSSMYATPAPALESGACPSASSSYAPYSEQSEQLRHGDVLVVYSDGVTEALDTAGSGVWRRAAGHVLTDRAPRRRDGDSRRHHQRRQDVRARRGRSTTT